MFRSIQNVYPTRVYRQWGIWHGVKSAQLDGAWHTFTARSLTRQGVATKLREAVYGE